MQMSDKNTWEPLSREEVIKAVERKQPSRIPLIHAKWWGEGLSDQYGRGTSAEAEAAGTTLRT